MELSLWATHSIVRSLNCAIVGVSLKADHKTRVWVPGTYLGSDPRKSREGEMDRDGRIVNELMSELPLGEGAQSFWGLLERACVPAEAEKLGYSPYLPSLIGRGSLTPCPQLLHTMQYIPSCQKITFRQKEVRGSL